MNRVTFGYELIQEIDQDGNLLGEPTLGFTIFDDLDSTHFGDYYKKDFMEIINRNDQLKLNFIMENDLDDAQFAHAIIESGGFNIREKASDGSTTYRWVKIADVKQEGSCISDLAVIDDNGNELYPDDVDRYNEEDE